MLPPGLAVALQQPVVLVGNLARLELDGLLPVHAAHLRSIFLRLLAPCTESNAELAPKRYVEDFLHIFTPMDPDEQAAHFCEHCEQTETGKAVCYCKFCAEGINMGGKTGVHLLELLFPAQ